MAAGEPWAAVVGFGLSGRGMTTSLTGLSSYLQELVPDGLRGRIMALLSVGFLGSRPFAATVDGAVADHVSLWAAFGLVAALGIVVAWLCRPSRLTVGVTGRRNAAGTLVP